MENTAINLALALIEGLGLIISPCILPILPLMLAGSLEGSKKRPIGIICGFMFTFAIFTFFSRKLVQLSGLDSEVIRQLAFFLLIMIAITMLSSTLTEKFGYLTRKLASVGTQSSLNDSQSGFCGGLLFGGLIALIWTPCAGPILAAVIVQTVIQKTTIASFLILLFFALGAGIPMLLIATFGRKLMAKFGFLKQQSGTLRKVLGAIILASVGLTYYNDTHSSTTYTNTNHGLGAEQTMLINGISPYPAPKIDGITAWINSAPLSLAELKGKIVLIDFWTYSCINCIRTLPHLINMYAKYHNKGLIIIGVHTPEFDFEKTLANVTSAVKKDGIPYPVALDSNYVTWQNFDNKYWPAEYLIDKNGNVVYQHFGEGENDVMENNIRFLLGINQVTNETPANENLADLIEQTTPETYLGSARAASFASPEKIIPNISSIYSFPDVLEKNNWALQGAWIISGENIISASEKAAIKINFHAKNVYIVMGNNSKKPLAIKILYNGESVIKHKGKDVINSAIQVTDHTLYEALAFDKPETGVLEIIAPRAGLELYTFTFGNK